MAGKNWGLNWYFRRPTSSICTMFLFLSIASQRSVVNWLCDFCMAPKKSALKLLSDTDVLIASLLIAECLLHSFIADVLFAFLWLLICCSHYSQVQITVKSVECNCLKVSKRASVWKKIYCTHSYSLAQREVHPDPSSLSCSLSPCPLSLASRCLHNKDLLEGFESDRSGVKFWHDKVRINAVIYLATWTIMVCFHS